MLDDPALIDRILARHNPGNDDFLVLYERHQRPIYGHLLRLAGAEAADGLFQQTWEIAYRDLADYDPEFGTFRNWLYGIAFNRVRSWRRRQGRQVLSETDPGERVDAERLPVDELMGKAEALVALRQCLQALPSRESHIYLMMVRQGLTLRAIAEQLQMTHAATRKAVSRARPRLLRCLQTKGVTGVA